MWGAVAAAGGNLLGGILQNQANAKQAGQQHDWSVEDAAANRGFQKEMSSTAHQREVTDLRSAGLNPILSANSGASTPGGAQASSQQAHMENVLGKGVTGAIDAIRLKNEGRLMGTQEGLNNANATAAYATASREATTAKLNEKNSRLLDATYGASTSKAKTEKGQAEYDLQMQQYDNIQRRIQNGMSTIGSARDAFLPNAKRGPMIGGQTKEKWKNRDETKEDERQKMFRDAENLFKPRTKAPDRNQTPRPGINPGY